MRLFAAGCICCDHRTAVLTVLEPGGHRENLGGHLQLGLRDPYWLEGGHFKLLLWR